MKLAVFLGAAAVVLAGAWWRVRGETLRLRARLEAAVESLERLQRSLARVAPEQLVDRIAAGGLPTRGERKEVTVLFADIVGFTALSERLEPHVLVEVLNGYFARMNRAIDAHRGHVSTLIGDGILALFGAFEPNPWQGDDAVHAALAMRAALDEYNRELENRGLPRLAVGIGLHRGVGVAGLVGSPERKDFAVVGGPVNVAARVQGLTRRYETDALLTEDLQRTLDPRFLLRRFPPAELRGISRPVPVFAVDGFAASGA